MKLDRLLSLLVVLLRRERVQAKELAAMFEVSVRTIYRDVEAINLAGIPVVTYQGAGGGIGIAAGYRLDRSVLTADEMAVFASLLQGISAAFPGMSHAVLLEKLKNTLSAAQLETLDAKMQQLIIDLSPWGGPDRQSEYIPRLRQAIETARVVEFVYVNADGMRTERRVQPYSLVRKGQAWYLYAWCLLRQDFRFFRLGRMKELTVTPVVFERKKISSQQILPENEWSGEEKLVEIEMVFIPKMADLAADWFGEAAERMDDGRTQVRIKLPESNWLYGFLLSFGAGAEVVGPPRIRAGVARIAAEITEKYASRT
ncbi:MAG: helix-turn-helix transcriptional regulator [bacterium]|jgi:predicted DNA-binding transcriptional regulator YafY